MADSTELNVKALGLEDLYQTTSSSLSYTRKDSTGTLQTVNRTAVSDELVISTTTKAKINFSSFTKIGQCLRYLHDAIGGIATTAAAGLVKVDNNASGNPIALTTVGTLASYIPSSAQNDAIDGADTIPSGTAAADAGNPFATVSTVNRALSLRLGSGKDGYGQLGAITLASTAVTVASGATGDLTGTYTYKVAAYNLSGTTAATTASGSINVTAKQVDITLPTLPSNCMGFRIYRSTDGVNYYYVGQAVRGYNYFTTGARANKYADTVTYPNTAISAPGSDTTGNTATLSGMFEFITFSLGASQTITVANSGNTAGLLDIRVQGVCTLSATSTITATGSNRINTFDIYSRNNGSTMLVASSAPTVVGTAANSVVYTPAGIGTDTSFFGKNMSGWGTLGALLSTTGAGVAGTGGYGGGLVRIWCYQFASNAAPGTITANGDAGTAATVGTLTSGYAQGGGGGGAGTIDLMAIIPWKDTGTRNAVGGAGGTTITAGGAVTVHTPGGGGGAVIRRNCFDKASATTSVAAGASSSAATSSAVGTTPAGCQGGGSYGNGGVASKNGSGYTHTAATAGQQFDLNGYFDPSIWAVA